MHTHVHMYYLLQPPFSLCFRPPSSHAAGSKSASLTLGEIIPAPLVLSSCSSCVAVRHRSRVSWHSFLLPSYFPFRIWIDVRMPRNDCACARACLASARKIVEENTPQHAQQQFFRRSFLCLLPALPYPSAYLSFQLARMTEAARDVGLDASHLYRVSDRGYKPVVAFKGAQDNGHNGYAGQLQQAFVKGVIEPVGEWHKDVSKSVEWSGGAGGRG